MCFQKCACAMLGDNFTLLFVFLSNRLNIEQMVLMALVARKIWFRRNAFIFEGEFAHPNSIVEEATKACEKFKWCNSPPLNRAGPARSDYVANYP
jgi:hypothetical protein